MLALFVVPLRRIPVWDQVLTMEGIDYKAYTQGAEQMQLKQIGTSLGYRCMP